jgi:hypothetical protein
MQPSNEAPRRKSNTGLIVGLILGGIGLCCVLPIALIGGGGLFMFNKVKGFATCGIAYEDLYHAIQDYAKANGGKLPNAATWQTDVTNYYKTVSSKHKDTGPIEIMPAQGEWGCQNEKGTTGIAFNKALSGKKLSDIKDLDKTPLLFEIDAPRMNAAEEYKKREPGTGPEMMMGQRRSWIVLMASGDMDVRDPQGKPMKIDFKTK